MAKRPLSHGLFTLSWAKRNFFTPNSQVEAAGDVICGMKDVDTKAYVTRGQPSVSFPQHICHRSMWSEQSLTKTVTKGHASWTWNSALSANCCWRCDKNEWKLNSGRRHSDFAGSLSATIWYRAQARCSWNGRCSDDRRPISWSTIPMLNRTPAPPTVKNIKTFTGIAINSFKLTPTLRKYKQNWPIVVNGYMITDQSQVVFYSTQYNPS